MRWWHRKYRRHIVRFTATTQRWQWRQCRGHVGHGSGISQRHTHVTVGYITEQRTNVATDCSTATSGREITTVAPTDIPAVASGSRTAFNPGTSTDVHVHASDYWRLYHTNTIASAQPISVAVYLTLANAAAGIRHGNNNAWTATPRSVATASFASFRKKPTAAAAAAATTADPGQHRPDHGASVHWECAAATSSGPTSVAASTIYIFVDFIFAYAVHFFANRYTSSFHSVMFRFVRLRIVHHHKLRPTAVAQRTQLAGNAAAPCPRSAGQGQPGHVGQQPRGRAFVPEVLGQRWQRQLTFALRR